LLLTIEEEFETGDIFYRSYGELPEDGKDWRG
jgi:hypothetical protein